MNESAQSKRDLAGCAVDCCNAVLLPGESVICSDCAFAVSPVIRAAVEAERKRCESEFEQERRDLIEEIQEARTFGGTYDAD